MESELKYYIECPLRSSCKSLANSFCGGCEECFAPVGFIKGGENTCDFCDECIEDELSMDG